LLISADATHGDVVITNGSIHYAHTGSTTGVDQFSYQVKNASNELETATVDLTISDDPRLPASTLAFPTTAPTGIFSAEIAYPSIRIQSPTAIESPPGDSKRLFATQLIGRVLLIPDASNASSPLINSLELKLLVNSREDETFQDIGGRGLLSLAFHSDFARNRQLFLSYTVLINGITYERLSRFLMSETSPDYVDPDSETVFIEIEQTASPNSHTGGDLHFGPEGYLYMSWGDEGGDNDAQNNAQKINQDFWSSIIRIDVDKRLGNVEPNPHPAIKLDDFAKAYYSVPVDNPFFTPPNTPNDVRTEFYAIGFRNPWRFSFDQQTGRLIVGDVGQNAREEISIVNKGDNHGWPYFEGDISGPKAIPPTNTSSFAAPTFTYTHSPTRKSVTGGVVYRGDRFPGLYGKYVFCDYVTGDIWSIDLDIGSSSLERLTGNAGIVSVGIDPSNGDILFVDYHDRLIRRLVATTPQNTLPNTLSQTGFFANLTTLEPNPGVIPYDVNLPFWSDHADKQRWFALPNGIDTIGFNKDHPWTFPTGMVWVKHFDLQTTRGNPATSKRLETRFFVKTEDSAYGFSYRWNEEGTEAFLVGDEGEEFDLDVIEDGHSLTQRWQIPSRSQCMSCHNPQAGTSLSFNTRQLNREGQLAGSTGNFLDLLKGHGYLTGLSTSTITLSRHVRANESDYSLGARAPILM
jgi:glucose/arabinose dehydrogenase